MSEIECTFRAHSRRERIMTWVVKERNGGFSADRGNSIAHLLLMQCEGNSRNPCQKITLYVALQHGVFHVEQDRGRWCQASFTWPDACPCHMPLWVPHSSFPRASPSTQHPEQPPTDRGVSPADRPVRRQRSGVPNLARTAQKVVLLEVDQLLKFEKTVGILAEH